MQKQFKFHSSIDGVLQLIVSLGYMCILVSWLIPLMLQGPFMFYRPQFIRIAFYISLTILFILYLSRLMFATLKETVYILTESAIIKRTPFKQTTVPFCEATAFRYVHAPLGFGFGFIRSAAKRIALPFLIDDLDGLVSGIQQSLIRENKQSVFIDKQVRAFIQHSRIAKFHLAHSASILPSFLLLMVFSIAINTFTALFIWSMPLLFSFLWIIISITVPCIGFLAGYAYITRNISRQLTKAPETPPVYDASGAYLISIFITFTIFLVIGILYKHIWIYLVR